MPLIYRDVRRPRPSEFRLPPWLVGMQDVQRIDHELGDVVGCWDPIVFGSDTLPPATAWKALHDDWQVALVGRLSPAEMLRLGPGLPDVIPVRDEQGRSWAVPAVFNPHGGTLLRLPMAKDLDGIWRREPTPLQRCLLSVAQAARDEVLTTTNERGESLSRFSRLPFAVGAEWTCSLLEAVYHLHESVIGVLGLLDDRLVRESLLAAAGFPVPDRV